MEVDVLKGASTLLGTLEAAGGCHGGEPLQRCGAGAWYRGELTWLWLCVLHVVNANGSWLNTW